MVYPQGIIVNEIMTSNSMTISDEDGDFSDWIELYNTGTVRIKLNGYSLSDDTLKLNKWQFGDAFIEPGEHLIVFASDKDKKMNYWHTNFKLSASGESLVLCDSNSNILDRINIPALSANVSYGRKSDGFSVWMIQKATPGSANTGEEIGKVTDSVSVSPPSGFFIAPVSVILSSISGNIFYSLDGSDPDTSSSKYSAPISIDKTTVLKTVSVDSNGLVSPAAYHTFFINESSDLPVVSLISDPVNLFDYNYGIYADGPGWTPNAPYYGANFWMDWERPAHVQFFEENKNLGFSKNCGISIYGAYTRSFPQKSFTIKFKDTFDSSPLEYELFPGFAVKEFNSIVLRNSGNDFQYTHIRDAMMQRLIRDLDIDYLEYRPAAAYINGKYWGIYNIREKISEHYVAKRHGVDPDNIDMLEGNMEVIHGDSLNYQELIDYISTHDMATDEAYDYVNKTLDIDNCLLYFAAEAYYNSQDWPANNVKYWRERSENGKWRWILYDLDFGFNLYETTGQSEDHIYYIFSGIETRPNSNPPWSTLLPRKLVENPAIKNKFVNLVADLLNTNFKSDRVVTIINEMKNHIANEGVKHRLRWGINQFTFDSHIQRMISFAQDRPKYLRGFVRNFFKSGSDGSITINSSEGGSVKLNSLNIEHGQTPWSGVYFRENPVQLKAVAKPGYKFDGWSGAVTSSDVSIALSVTGSTNVTASFSPEQSDAANIVINEINYNSIDDFDPGDWIEIYNKGEKPVDLSGWHYSDSDESHKFFFPEGTVLEPGSYLVVVENDSLFASLFPDVKNFVGETGFGLSGSGEYMKIVDAMDAIVDSLTYDDKSPWPLEADGKGATLELSDAGSDNALGENWKASTGHGSPGKINSAVTDIEKQDPIYIPSEYLLSQNYPNPFNPETIINYRLPESGYVSLKVYDMLGRETAVLVDEYQNPGIYNVRFDIFKNANGRNLSSGMYFYRLQTSGFTLTKKMMLIK